MNLRLFPAGVAAGAIALFALCGQTNALTVSIASEDTTDFTAGTIPGSSTNAAWVAALSNNVAIKTSQVPNQWRSPFENKTNIGGGVLLSDGGYGIGAWSTLEYTSIQANGKATYNFDSPMTTLTFLWGSPDDYNHITFYEGVDGSGNSYTINVPPIGILTYGHDQIVFGADGGLTFQSVVLSTGQNAFEYANLFAFGPTLEDFPSSTPLPAALPLFATGLGALGLLGWRRKRKNAAITA